MIIIIGMEPASGLPRLVNIVVFREFVPHERLMCNELRRLSCAQGIRQLFVVMNPAAESVRLVGDILYIPGAESVDGILYKTVEAMRYCLQCIPFDFLIRSNISTVIDFAALAPVLAELDSKVITYASTQWFHIREVPGDYSQVWGGLPPAPAAGADPPLHTFASGTNIVLSRPAVEHLVSHPIGPNARVADDVSIGDMLLRVCEPCQLKPAMQWDNDTPGATVYRNRKEDDRDVDVRRMQKTVDRLVGAAGSY
jgi:hypothetical protein